MASSKTIHVTTHTPIIIHGTWLLDIISAVVERVGDADDTYRGLYLALHINGPAALPTPYATSMMAFVVTLFVCPAVVCDTQVKVNTKLVTPVTDNEG